MITPKSIDQLRQNKPTQIVTDLMECHQTFSGSTIYEILLSRGVFKWFSVRRKLIKLKDRWKDRGKTAFDYQIISRELGRWNRVWYWRGYRRALEECRAEVRELCHSPRWQCQDNDPAAAKWLYDREDQLKAQILEKEKSLVLPDCEGSTCEIPKDSLSNLGGVR